MNRVFFIIILIIFESFLSVRAQEVEIDTTITYKANLLWKADSLHKNLNFNKAVILYKEILSSNIDSLSKLKIESKLFLSENGMSMMNFSYKPIVVAKQTFSLNDFFLYYPLENKSWRKIPNQLDSSKTTGLVRATYIPEGSKNIYYSAKDSDKVRNLYNIQYKDSIWALPRLVNPDLTSAFNEAYPLISKDGKTMYFSSEGLYGVGGYDLYKSKWDEKTGNWGAPTNLGFPFSSPANDFLFFDTADDKYSIFASDRDSPKDSINVYVIEFENNPIHTALTEEELKEIMSLVPKNDLTTLNNNISASSSIPENIDIEKYSTKAKEVKGLRDSISIYSDKLNTYRTRYTEVDNTDERANLTSTILSMEEELPLLQEHLNKALSELQEIEMQFLFSGVAIDPQSLLQEVDREVIGASTSYAFSKLDMGTDLILEIEEPVKEFDYSFMILPQARFAENNELPNGLIYQIQIMTSSKKASIAQLNGLSPIFEQRNNSGIYIYSVGLFSSYNNVSTNLNKVKKLGFKTAYLTAANNGRPITVSNAKVLERNKQYIYDVNIYYDQENLPTSAITAISQMTNKQTSKVIKSGAIVHIVEDISSLDIAEKLKTSLMSVGLSNIFIKKRESSEN